MINPNIDNLDFGIITISWDTDSIVIDWGDLDIPVANMMVDYAKQLLLYGNDLDEDDEEIESTD